jgi:protein gp37
MASVDDGKFQQHPLSALFPSMPSDAFAELRTDIAEHGLRQAITLYNGKVLDGWHRCRACCETGTEIRTVNFTGDERAALPSVLSANVARRHLTTSDRSLIAARLATLKRGAGQKDQMSLLRIEEAAEHLKVSPNSVKRARKVLDRGDPELIARVRSHELSVSAASRLLPPPARPRVVAEGGYTIEAWHALPDDERTALLSLRNPKARLNRQNSSEDGNSIDWGKWSYSPITGCKHNCPYCYISDFVSEVPMFHPNRLSAPLNQSPPVTNDLRDRCIFVGSLADLFGRWVPTEWIEAILEVFRACPQWIFIVCTKFPQRLLEFEFPANVWIGTTIDKQDRVAAAESAFAQLRERDRKRVLWGGLEPMLERIRFNRLDLFNRLVIGGASATQHSPAWYPPLRLVDEKRREARAAGCSLYEKSNLLLKESLGVAARYEFTDEPPFPAYLKRPR